MLTGLTLPMTQQQFGDVVGITQQRVAQMIDEGVLSREGTAGEWLMAYCARLREQAAGRGHELTIERAALARSQRVGQDIKNALAAREYAPVGLLTDVLAAASTAVVERFDALQADLARLCPDLEAAARDAVLAVLASARNEWVRSTASLLQRAVEDMVDDEEEPVIVDVEEDEPTP